MRQLRRAGSLTYAWIADMSRRGYFVNTFSAAGDFRRRVNALYRADLWQDADYRCEVWTESRSIASVLMADCEELAVDLFPCGGFSSLSFLHEAAQQNNQSDDERPLVVLYVGDLDQAGVLIDQSLQRELRAHLRATIELIFERIGINQNQIDLYDLPEKPRKVSDVRAQHVLTTVEAKAMPAAILRGLIRDRIESLLPENALEVARVAEASEREHLVRFAEALGTS